MVAPEVILGGAQFATNLVSGFLGASSADSQRRDQQQSAERQVISNFQSAYENWQFEDALSQLNFDYATNSAKLSFAIESAVALMNWKSANALEEARHIVASTNNEMEWLSQNAAQNRDYQITQLLQAADQRQQMRIYEASEKTFSENTRLIASAAKQAYAFEKDRLRFERAGMRIDSAETRARFEGEKTQANLQAKQIETRYRSELRQAGFSGEALQLEVKKRMQQFTGKQDAARREASAEASRVAASGKTGATAARMMRDPFNQADVMLGSMGVELAYFGNEQQVELLKLAEATGLAGAMADLDRQRIYANLDTSERMTNLTLEGLNLQEREAIFKSNNTIDDIGLQAKSQLNEARSNRELRPMAPVNLPEPLPIAKSLIPEPFLMPRPLQTTPGLQPFLPAKPLTAPMPRMGAVPTFGSNAGSILAGSIFQGVASGLSAYQSALPPSGGNIQPMNAGGTIRTGIFSGQ